MSTVYDVNRLRTDRTSHIQPSHVPLFPSGPNPVGQNFSSGAAQQPMRMLGPKAQHTPRPRVPGVFDSKHKSANALRQGHISLQPTRGPTFGASSKVTSSKVTKQKPTRKGTKAVRKAQRVKVSEASMKVQKSVLDCSSPEKNVVDDSILPMTSTVANTHAENQPLSVQSHAEDWGKLIAPCDEEINSPMDDTSAAPLMDSGVVFLAEQTTSKQDESSGHSSVSRQCSSLCGSDSPSSIIDKQADQVIRSDEPTGVTVSGLASFSMPSPNLGCLDMMDSVASESAKPGGSPFVQHEPVPVVDATGADIDEDTTHDCSRTEPHSADTSELPSTCMVQYDDYDMMTVEERLIFLL